MQWDCGQELKVLGQVSKTPMQLDRLERSHLFGVLMVYFQDLMELEHPFIGAATVFSLLVYSPFLMLAEIFAGHCQEPACL
jgi:hypothetical protein